MGRRLASIPAVQPQGDALVREGTAENTGLGGEPKGPASLAHYFIGLGLVWAWVYCMRGNPSLFSGLVASQIAEGTGWAVGPAAVTVALFALGFLLRRTPLCASRALCLSFTCLFTLGTALLCAPVGPIGAPWLLHSFARVLAGVGYAGLCILWGSAICSLGIEEAETVVLAASGVTTVCALCLQFLERTPVLSAVTVAVPAVSGLLLVRAGSSGAPAPNRARHDAVAPGRGRVSWTGKFPPMQMLAFIVACYLAIGASDVVQGPSVGLDLPVDVPTVLGTGVGVVLSACVVFFSTRIDLTFLYRWMLPVLTAALVLSPWDNACAQIAGQTLFWAGDTCVQAVVLLCFIRLAKKGTVPISVGIGIGQGCIQLGVFLGAALKPALLAMGFVGASAQSVAMALVLILVCLASSMPRTYFETGTSSIGGPVRGTNTAGPQEGAEITGTSIPAQTARRYGLTERETQILGYLARGRSAPFIREELSLSKSTVATHIRHIYDKLGVHSKQELLSLLEQESRP